ncbi:MAG: hypothetical protein HOO67_02675, partial [Candidatus Peribacteraceae bacterium]|nr:hypothetical protein [Candidatus Peribacteraceae bacterium]
MAENKVGIEISVEGDAEAKLKGISDGFLKLGDDAEKGTKKASTSFDVFKGVLEARGVEKAIELVASAAEKLFEVFIVDGVKAAIAQEDAINKLNQALASAGEFSQEASKDFIEFAESMQDTTKFSNDAILRTGALIESLGHLSVDGLKGATTAAANLSAALGVDLETAARKLGLAAEGNVASFKKFGITVKEGATNAETFANAVAAVNAKFGGAAASQVLTFSGGVEQLKNNFDDLVKVFG